MIPRATMRLQLHAGFTFDDVAKLVPYFRKIGISHVYASPITTARKGSMHGYDVIDPTRVNPELGGEEGLRKLVAALRAAQLGLIVDIVPNHMAVGTDNPWWTDVLCSGRESRFVTYFDIDWETQDQDLHGKLLLPVLGKPYAEALQEGEITLACNAAGDFEARYYGQSFPIARRDHAEIERVSPSCFDPATQEGRHRLDQLLSRQHYRLAWWRLAGDELNWRRFFDVNELAGLRMEEPQVFEHVHALIFRLYEEGLVDGVRIDHIDGLAEPGAYCRSLRQRLERLRPNRPPSAPADRPYIVVEKILLHGEQLPESWGSDGTSGYDFMDQVNLLQHAEDARAQLAETWATVSGRPRDFAVEEEDARRQILEQSFNGQLQACARAFQALARMKSRDFSVPALARLLREILAHFPIYRTYGPYEDRAHDAPFLEMAFAKASKTRLPSDALILNSLRGWLSDPCDGEAIGLQRKAVTRFQQLSAPLAAKAVEDTAAYRYGRLISRNDVGFDLPRLGMPVADFHAAMLARRRRYPHGLLATATHDHKRGEDVRARLAVISEVPDAWSRRLKSWIEQSVGLRQSVKGVLAPTPGDLAILFQTIVGSWPLDLDIDDDARLKYVERLSGWQQKALREAKIETSWIVPDTHYEEASRAFLMQLVAHHGAPALLDDIVAFSREIAPAGAVNGLSQAVLKLTAPGVPDLYQGTDLWDFSLVDPDNRRPVRFKRRVASLGAVDVERLMANWRDGAIKQNVIARILALRAVHPAIFSEGGYEPVEFRGTYANHAVGFIRRNGEKAIIVVVPRLIHGMLDDTGSVAFPPACWKDTAALLHLGLGTSCIDIFTGSRFTALQSLPIQALFGRFPVAVLVAEPLAKSLN